VGGEDGGRGEGGLMLIEIAHISLCLFAVGDVLASSVQQPHSFVLVCVCAVCAAHSCPPLEMPSEVLRRRG
jgi:hypothetical protein